METLRAIVEVAQEDLASLLFMLMLVVGLLFILNAVDFHFRHQKALDRKVMKDRYYSGGTLFDVSRLMLYGHYCLFPARARRDGVAEVFADLAALSKARLVFHWGAGISGVLLLLSSWALRKWNGRI